MKFYIRKLNAQELGYRDGRVRQAGRYILISKLLQRETDFFPKFDEKDIEPSIAVGCINSANNILVYCEYIWHNGSAHRGKDLRLYLNEDIDPLNTFYNKDDIIVFYKFENDGEYLYKIFRFNTADREYEALKKITENKTHYWTDNLEFIDIKNKNFISPKFSRMSLERVNQRIGDPSENTLSASEFRPFIREIYKYRCAVTNTFINPSHYWNLQAAHIKPELHKGPLRPDNGLLLCRDMHFAFDYGCFTLNKNFEVTVHEQMKNSSLIEFHGKKINLPDEKKFYPNIDYINFHKENIFGRLKPLRDD